VPLRVADAELKPSVANKFNTAWCPGFAAFFWACTWAEEGFGPTRPNISNSRSLVVRSDSISTTPLTSG
jgi:hypothetical protein